jgi:hypothetical protein
VNRIWDELVVVFGQLRPEPLELFISEAKLAPKPLPQRGFGALPIIHLHPFHLAIRITVRWQGYSAAQDLTAVHPRR